jgi:predicted HTH transcriptional regulator
MTSNPFKTLHDLGAIVTDQIPESVTLEYKGSNVLAARDANALCKAVTAFANSAGGQFVVGVESKDGKPVLLDGGVGGSSRLDWVHKIINANTYPPVESVEVLEIREEIRPKVLKANARRLLNIQH